MAWHKNLYLLIAALLYGCSSSDIVSDVEVQALRHMAIADTLEHASAFQEATLEYKIVAERFPLSSVYATAVRKTALLLGSPTNPAANDSASLYWLNIYIGLTTSPEEKQIIQMYLNVVGRVKVLRDSLTRKSAINDSLLAVTRKQGGEAVTRARRILELEAELQKASNELRKLKEIDVRISKSRGKNNQ
jgi:transposase-like protein